jgi:mono/diheme cytochrome c family protein
MRDLDGRRRWGLALLVLLLGAARPALGQEPEDDEAAIQHALAERSFRENCLICHAAEMTTSQRLTADQWKAEMTKMIGWGAPVPAEQADGLTAWLIAEFGPDRPVEEPARVELDKSDGRPPGNLVARLTAQADLQRGESLYRANCANCHGADAQGGDLGPNLVERPSLVRDADWRSVVLVGRNRMPGYRQVLDDRQEADLRAWLLGLTYRPRDR